MQLWDTALKFFGRAFSLRHQITWTVACTVLGTSLLLTLFFIGGLCYSDIHDVLGGLLGLMGRSPQVFSFSSLDCFDKQGTGFKKVLNFSQKDKNHSK